jgi:hypothetical protein
MSCYMVFEIMYEHKFCVLKLLPILVSLHEYEKLTFKLYLSISCETEKLRTFFKTCSVVAQSRVLGMTLWGCVCKKCGFWFCACVSLHRSEYLNQGLNIMLIYSSIILLFFLEGNYVHFSVYSSSFPFLNLRWIPLYPQNYRNLATC